MNNYVQPGEIVTLTASGTVTAGTVYKTGSIIALALTSAATTERYTAQRTGVITYTRATGGSSAWTEGVAIYWDDSAKKFTKTSASNTLVGVAAAATGDSDATGDVLLDGAIR